MSCPLPDLGGEGHLHDRDDRHATSLRSGPGMGRPRRLGVGRRAPLRPLVLNRRDLCVTLPLLSDRGAEGEVRRADSIPSRSRTDHSRSRKERSPQARRERRPHRSRKPEESDHHAGVRSDGNAAERTQSIDRHAGPDALRSRESAAARALVSARSGSSRRSITAASPAVMAAAPRTGGVAGTKRRRSRCLRTGRSHCSHSPRPVRRRPPG